MSPSRAVGAKATTPTPSQRDRARANSGAISHLRKEQVQTPQERWAAAVDGVLARFRASMAEMYADDPETAQEASGGQDGGEE